MAVWLVFRPGFYETKKKMLHILNTHLLLVGSKKLTGVKKSDEGRIIFCRFVYIVFHVVFFSSLLFSIFSSYFFLFFVSL